MTVARPRTLFQKVWDGHVVRPATADTPAVLFIDLHLVHEVTSWMRCRSMNRTAGVSAVAGRTTWPSQTFWNSVRGRATFMPPPPGRGGRRRSRTGRP